LQSQEFLDFVSDLTGIPDLLHDPDYVGGGTHENRHGQGLDAHVDFNYHPRTRWHRRLNLIVYLNEQWEPGWGGELELHSDPWDVEANRTVSILPGMNRAVIFETTETSWHGFSQIRLPQGHRHASRRSFAICLYTRERPAQETAPLMQRSMCPQ
jgi:Rps23 Pro-64 3,4-dihydroxylase Tpa1-like proline 4-hydroxylase